MEDTFVFTVESENGFEPGAVIKFQVAKDEDDKLLVDKSFNLDGTLFKIELNKEEKPDIGEYIYRLLLLSTNGSVITQKSGELEIKWGA